jgi:ribose 5-phosphate isomerase B
MKLVFAADHAGVGLKDKLVTFARGLGHEVQDCGTQGDASVDYPDFAHQATRVVAAGQADFGILCCGSGTGMAISANKTPGIRAANCWEAEIAQLARSHNDANVLCLPARFVSESDARAMVQTFLATAFEGGRHAGRVGKIESNC